MDFWEPKAWQVVFPMLTRLSHKDFIKLPKIWAKTLESVWKNIFGKDGRITQRVSGKYNSLA